MVAIPSKVHKEQHPFAGKTVKIKKEVTHPQVWDFGGGELLLEDWWDRLVKKSWKDCDGNPACMIYASRVISASGEIPLDDEVVYGKLKGLGHLVHVSELEF